MNPDLHHALAWLDAGLDVAVATVVSTWGSAPRQAGSQMFINERGEFWGSVSGGCVESAVIDEASELMKSGERKLLSYGVTNDMAWEVGLACGGQVEVLVERIRDRSVIELLADRSEAGMVVRAIDLETGEAELLRPELGALTGPSPSETGSAHDELIEAARAAISEGRSQVVEHDGNRIFLHLLAPPVRVLIVGAVHIAQALASMVQSAGYEVVVVDPRTAFATADRFPGVELATEWPKEAFDRIGLDRRTAVVTVTHDPKLDDPAIVAGLESEVFYLGALGSRRTHAKRVERLQGAGFDGEAIGRIRAPVGLDIGARTPGEIAASILAEIVRELRAPTA